MKVEKYNDIICLDLAPEQEKSHRGSASSCPDRKTMSLNWTEKKLDNFVVKNLFWAGVDFFKKYLFWVRVEPFGQTELSLPAEEEDKLDRHCKLENKTSSSSPYLPKLVVIRIVSARSLWNPSCCWQFTRRIHFATSPPPVCPVCPVCPAGQSRYRGVPPAWLADKGQTWTQTHNKHKFDALFLSIWQQNMHIWLADTRRTLTPPCKQKWSTLKLYFEWKE